MGKVIFVLFIFLISGCAGNPCQTYVMGPKLDNLNVNVCDEYTIGKEYRKRIKKGYTNPQGKVTNVLGFYSPTDNALYTINDFGVLLHEVYHASGIREEPYWEKNAKRP